MKKQIVFLLLAITTIFVATKLPAKELIENNDARTVTSKGILDISDIDGYPKEGVTMLPLREVAEGKLNLKVKWVEATQSIEIGDGPSWTSIKVGRNRYFFARIAPFELSHAPEIKNGRTYVPIDFFTKVLNYEIKAAAEEFLFGFIKRVTITDKSQSILVAATERNKSIDEVLFRIGADTKIVNESEKPFNITDLKVGTKVKVSLPKMLTLSLPPQGTSEKIIITDTAVFIKEATIKGKKDIKYPVLVGVEKKIEKEINAEIKKFIATIQNNDLYKELELGYEVSYLSDEKISLLFNGSFSFGTTVKQIVKSKNFDLKSGKEITFNNFFDTSPIAQEKLMRLLQKTAKEQQQIEFEAEGKEIYFRGTNVVLFYYPLDDSVVNPVHLYLPIEDIQEIIKK